MQTHAPNSMHARIFTHAVKMKKLMLVKKTPTHANYINFQNSRFAFHTCVNTMVLAPHARVDCGEFAPHPLLGCGVFAFLKYSGCQNVKHVRT